MPAFFGFSSGAGDFLGHVDEEWRLDGRWGSKFLHFYILFHDLSFYGVEFLQIGIIFAEFLFFLIDRTEIAALLQDSP